LTWLGTDSALRVIDTGCATLPDLLRGNADIMPKSCNVIAKDTVKGFLNVRLVEAMGSTETTKKQKGNFCFGQSRLLNHKHFGVSMIKCHVASNKMGQTVSQVLCSAPIEVKRNVTGSQGGCEISQISCSSSSRPEIHEGYNSTKREANLFAEFLLCTIENQL
jgi:hypothetical protein